MNDELRQAAIAYMRDELYADDPEIVDMIVRDGEALVLFGNDVCLLLQQYGWSGDKWDVITETDREDFERNQ